MKWMCFHLSGSFISVFIKSKSWGEEATLDYWEAQILAHKDLSCECLDSLHFQQALTNVHRGQLWWNITVSCQIKDWIQKKDRWSKSGINHWWRTTCTNKGWYKGAFLSSIARSPSPSLCLYFHHAVDGSCQSASPAECSSTGSESHLQDLYWSQRRWLQSSVSTVYILQVFSVHCVLNFCIQESDQFHLKSPIETVVLVKGGMSTVSKSDWSRLGVG